jgi:hypothetical protein
MTTLQVLVLAGLQQLASANGSSIHIEQRSDVPHPFYSVLVVHQDTRYLFEVYEDQAALVFNGGRYDSEIFATAGPKEKAEDFLRRVDRFMVTRNWYGPEDPSFFDSIKAHLSAVFRALWRRPSR